MGWGEQKFSEGRLMGRFFLVGEWAKFQLEGEGGFTLISPVRKFWERCNFGGGSLHGGSFLMGRNEKINASGRTPPYPPLLPSVGKSLICIMCNSYEEFIYIYIYIYIYLYVWYFKHIYRCQKSNKPPTKF